MPQSHSLTANISCNDLTVSETFYAKLGFWRTGGEDSYRILSDEKGGEIHFTAAVDGWLIPGRNPFGLYLYSEDVEKLAESFGMSPEDKSWGMYEFAVSDPDETLVRIGWPTRLRNRE
jgi:hypothetical protein